MAIYSAAENRYDVMKYFRCGKSGVKLPAISLGFWHNFGEKETFDTARNMVRTAFNLGINHFDLANNYGPPAGAAEETFGEILKKDFLPYRDEMFISSKAGYYMWPGPYGDFGSKKYLVASLDQSLKRMGLDYVDLFYSHRPDPETPLEETMGALAHIVRSGKALYVGISSYSSEMTKQACTILKGMGVKCLIHQPSYSMLNRGIENGLQEVLTTEGVGSIAFCPLQQGLLTSRYLKGIPEGSRADKPYGALKERDVTDKVIEKVKKLSIIAEKRGQTMAQMALAWVLRNGKVTSALIGASRPEQIIENVKAVENLNFSEEELKAIENILA